MTQKNLTFRPREQAAMPKAVARCVFPVPDGPTMDVLAAVEILALHEFEYLRLVDARPGCEVKLVEHLGGGEPRVLEPPLRRLPLSVD